MGSSTFFIRTFFILLILLSFISIASAESGNLIIDAIYGVLWTNENLVVSDGNNFNWSKFAFDYTNFNRISKITVYLESGWTIPSDAGSSAFTIISGGSGSGTVSLNKLDRTVIFYFSYPTTITSTPVILSITNHAFLDTLTPGVGGIQTSSSAVGLTQPVLFYGDTVVSKCATTDSLGCSFNIQLSKYFVNAYSTSYSNGLVNITIDKSMSTQNSNITIRNDTAQKFSEMTFDLTGFSYSYEYDTGLSLNMSDASGNYDFIIVNGTDYSGYTVPVDPGTGGSLSGQVYFDYSTAALTYPYGINVSVLAANWSDWFSPTFRIKVIAPSDSSNPAYTVSGFPIDFSAQYYNTSRLWNFEWVGTYNASLYNCGWARSGCLLSDGILIDTATLTIAQTPYVYSVTSDANSYSTGDVIRFNISNPSPQETFFNMFLQRGTSGGTGEIYNLIVPANSVKYVNVTVTGDMTYGSWEGSLNTKKSSGSTLTDKVASKVFSISIPAPGSKVSVKWDSNSVLGETNNLYYTTNQNASTVTVNKTLPGSNASITTDTFTAYPTDTQPKQYLMDAVGQWVAKITDNGNASNTSTATITIAGISGCNKNLPDYVCWDKTTYLRGDPFVINYKATNLPEISSTVFSNYYARLLIYDPDGIMVVNKTILNTWESTILKPYTLPVIGMHSRSFNLNAKAGKWHAIIMKDGTTTNSYMDGSVVADSYAIVVDSSTAAGGGGTNATSTPGTPRAIIDGFTVLFGWGVNDVSRFFFALLFVTAGMFAGFMMSGKNLYGGVFGAFLPWAFFALPSVNYIPSWVTIFIAIIVALKIGWFK